MHERELYALLRQERDYVETAVRQLRHEAIQRQYRSGEPPETAFGLASIVDMVALRWNDIDDEVRVATLQWAHDVLVGGPVDLPPQLTR